jgi:hypothetical protein
LKRPLQGFVKKEDDVVWPSLSWGAAPGCDDGPPSASPTDFALPEAAFLFPRPEATFLFTWFNAIISGGGLGFRF